MKERIIKLEIEISVPAQVSAETVQSIIDKALDEEVAKEEDDDWIIYPSEIKKDTTHDAESGRFNAEDEEEGLDDADKFILSQGQPDEAEDFDDDLDEDYRHLDNLLD